MSQFVASRAYDYFDLGEESDQERAESSEDEIDIILHGTPEQRRRLRQVHEKEQQKRSVQRPGRSKSQQPQDEGEELSSEDDFEREMNAELEKTIHMLEESRGENQSKGQTSSSSKDSPGEGSASKRTASKKKTPFYSSIYFDSDDDENYEGEGDAKVPRQHARPSNDDLMYDPDMDDEDQRWVDQQRQRHLGTSRRAAGNSKKRGAGNKKHNAPTSDAILDCPACMTTLCLDCQRHDIYPNQYRAMFVMNCKVNTSEVLSVPEQDVRKKSKKSKKSSLAKGGDSEEAADSANQSSLSQDKFHQVTCTECNTIVGVVDMDEVYHFFNVLTSQP